MECLARDIWLTVMLNPYSPDSSAHPYGPKIGVTDDCVYAVTFPVYK